MNIWTEAAHSITKLLIHSLWVGTFVYLVLIVALRFLPKHLAAMRYGIACSGLIAIPILTLLTHSHPVFHPDAPLAHFSLDPLSEAILTPALISPEGWNLIPVAIAVTWILGAILSGIRSTLAYSSMSSVSNEAIRISDPSLLHRLDSMRARLGIRRPVQLLMSHRLQSPITFGWLRPVIIFPVSMLTNIPPAHLGPIIAHELAHISRSDFPFSLIAKGIEAALFFHPAVWSISRIIREEREQACDDIVVAEPYSVKRYAKALCWIEAHRVDAETPMFHLAVDGTSVISRIDRLVAISNEHPLKASTMRSLFQLALSISLTLSLTLNGNAENLENCFMNAQPITSISASIEDARLANSIIAHTQSWNSKESRGRRLPLFISVPIIERDGNLFVTHDNSPPLFPQFPNSWVFEHDLNILDSQLPYRDADGDGFTNDEEFRHETDPRSTESHPLLINKLAFQGLKSHRFTIHYTAQPDEKTAQLHLTDHRYKRKETAFFSVGDITESGVLQVDAIDKTAVRATFLPTGKNLTLSKNASVTASIPYAEFQYGDERFFVRDGNSFSITAEPDVAYQLVSVQDEKCVVKLPDGEPRILPAPSP